MSLQENRPHKDLIVSVAVPVPLRQTFDFLVPKSLLDPPMSDSPGGEVNVAARTRVKVSFANRTLIGVIVEVKTESDFPLSRLKPIVELFRDPPLFDDALWNSLLWLSRYYLAPIGEVLESALPVSLRKGNELTPSSERVWRLSEHGRSSAVDELNRAPLQLAIVRRFMKQSTLSSKEFKQESGNWHSPVKSLVDKGWLEEFTQEPILLGSDICEKSSVTLTNEQSVATEALTDLMNAEEFSCSLLHGVTGSGKTEVYFDIIGKTLAKGKTVLVLVPEIGLTPQLLERIQRRFEQPMTVLHSGLNDTERHTAWWHASQGHAKIVLGTRSAVFTQIPKLGLIVVDEEHDGSFKQQDSVRYQARDLAVYRAKQANVPIVLGSATPSMETYANAKAGRYLHLRLTKRASDVALPKIELFDLNTQPVIDGLCPAMTEAVEHTLSTGKQVMLFLNRRGYAPVHYCGECKQAAKCHRCDSNLTVHQRANRLRCHHCGYEGRLLNDCRSCHTKDSMLEVGDGTQRVESALATRFPEARVQRIDRDNTQRKGALTAVLEKARNSEVDIILGTQLITKGHDFPNVGMVGILECDHGLYSTDYRATETLFQQVLQVSGRAGRRQDVGRVYIQSRFPEHPFFDYIKQHDFDGFADNLLAERKSVGFPPFGYFALLRAESTHQAKALQFLRRAKSDCGQQDGVIVMDAVPAPMERKAGRFRAQLLFMSSQRSSLNAMLSNWLHYIATDKEAKKAASSVRWNLDIDPLDHY
ncbi:primosomal protein N' [Arenicella sp. 4NH20-0111]|uniref:primosomal protein N' n=1 Tax=Arenicella sp. 4NH20-0111 TaxID=3127648 RepID=UPI003102316A